VFRRSLPKLNQELRRELYSGTVFHLPASAASLALVEQALALLHDQVERESELRRSHHQLGEEEFLLRLGKVRQAIFLDRPFHLAARRVIADAGFDPASVALDPIRLAVVAETDHKNPRAAQIYYPHRDTWYGHSQSAIIWWIPLHPLAEPETLVFYPERFDQAVPNDSERFHYTSWVEKGWDLQIGWQDADSGSTADYPGVRGRVDCGRPQGFSCQRGENLLFSAAQFHRTLPQEAGLARYSLQFRLVHLEDNSRGTGAPNVDNRSRGSALVDYLAPESL
jgi:hypothetical protein